MPRESKCGAGFTPASSLCGKSPSYLDWHSACFGADMPRIQRLSLVVVMIASPPCCSDDAKPAPQMIDRSACQSVSSPLTSGTASPTLAHLSLNCESSGVVPEAIVLDPQGDADLQNVPQRLEAFTDLTCSGEVVAIEDDVVAAGKPEWFGTLIDRSSAPSLYEAVCASTSWPVRVHIRDASGNVTTGVVEAPVLQQ